MGPVTTDQRPLAGIRVLDLSRVLAGPHCATMLADAGAEVIKVERPGSGDESRGYGSLWNGVGLDFLNVNRGKRGLALDLKHAEGAKVLRSLAATADVLIENFVPGTMERFGLDYPRVSQDNPRLIYCSISAYGERGELAGKPGYDGALQAFTGHMSLTGEPDGRPVRTGASVIDMTTGIAAYGAIVTALLQRKSTGCGQRLTLSLMHTALSLMGTHAAVTLNTDKDPKRAGSGVSHLAPYGAYRTADSYVVVGALNEQSWRRLCATLGVPALADDERFATMQQRLMHRADLDSALEARFLTATAAQWIAALSGQGLVVSKVNNLRDALADPQVTANDLVADLPDAGRRLRYVRSPMGYESFDNRSRFGPPGLGEHTRQVLVEAGLTDEQVDRLVDAGVVAELAQVTGTASGR